MARPEDEQILDVDGFLLELVDNIIRGFVDAWVQFAKTISEPWNNLSFVNPLDLVLFIPRVLLGVFSALDQLIADLTNNAGNSLVKTVAGRVRPPPWMKTTVMTGADAFREVIDTILIRGWSAFSFQPSYIAERVAGLKGRMGKIKLLRQGKWLELLDKVIISKIKATMLTLAKLCLAILSYLALLFLFLTVLVFIKDINNGTAMTKLLSQKKRRFEQRLLQGGTIMRRYPVGNQPDLTK